MKSYLIALHLTAPRDDYRYLEIELIAKRAKPLTRYAFTVTAEESATEIAEDLLRHLRHGDSLIITEFVGSAVVREFGEVDT